MRRCHRWHQDIACQNNNQSCLKGQSDNSHNAPFPYPTIHYIGTEMFTFLFQCGVFVRYGTGALWDDWDWSIDRYHVVFQWISARQAHKSPQRWQADWNVWCAGVDSTPAVTSVHTCGYIRWRSHFHVDSVTEGLVSHLHCETTSDYTQVGWKYWMGSHGFEQWLF